MNVAIADPPHRRVDQGFPLGFSVDPEDARYDARVLAQVARFDVLLDGDRMDRFVSYDVPAGKVVRYRRDWRGRPMLNGREFERETLTGTVEVRWLPGQVPAEGPSR